MLKIKMILLIGLVTVFAMPFSARAQEEIFSSAKNWGSDLGL